MQHDGRTLVAMSGGVDSAVAAVLAARELGADVVAVTLDCGPTRRTTASSRAARRRPCAARAASRTASASPHFTLDLRDEFRAGVVEPWLVDHAEGLTPNPCVRCNGHVRLDAMLEFADRLGAGALTTGHYARGTDDGLLRLAADPAKDQAYMLAALSRPAMTGCDFPLGELPKPAVRALAEPSCPSPPSPTPRTSASWPASGRANFLARHGGMRSRPGDILDRAGAVVGRHDGHHGFTVGQRRGLGGGAREPLYVLATDARANTVTVGPRDAARDHDRPRARPSHARHPARRGAAPLPLAGRALPAGRRGDPPRRALRRRCPGADRGLPRGGRDRRMRHNRRVTTTDEIRETFLRFFEARDHLRLPSASLVPSAYGRVGPADDGGDAPARAVLPR